MGWIPFISMFAILLFFLFVGIPIAFSFGLANLLTIILFVGPQYINMIVWDSFSSVASFLFIAFPLFILMSELFHYSGIADTLVRILSVWLRRLPGGLALTATIGSAIFGALSGSTMATCAAMGTAAIPPLRKNGYSKEMSTGVIVFGGVLDFFIPPSAMVVIYASLAQESVGKLLVGGMTPGILLTILGCLYIIITCKLKPPISEIKEDEYQVINRRELIIESIKYFIPLGLVIFAVTVTIYLGIATPSEAAALGCAMTIAVLAAYRKFNFGIFKGSLMDAMNTTAMVFFIVVGSTSFSHLLFFTGSSQKVIGFIVGFHLPPLMVAALMFVIALVLGCFIDIVSIMFITLPIFNPLVAAMGLDPIWFGLLYLYCLALGAMTPPFGVNLFVTKSVAPRDITLQDVYRGSVPFIIISLAAFPIFLIFPQAITWLPKMVLK